MPGWVAHARTTRCVTWGSSIDLPLGVIWAVVGAGAQVAVKVWINGVDARFAVLARLRQQDRAQWVLDEEVDTNFTSSDSPALQQHADMKIFLDEPNVGDIQLSHDLLAIRSGGSIKQSPELRCWHCASESNLLKLSPNNNIGVSSTTDTAIVEQQDNVGRGARHNLGAMFKRGCKHSLVSSELLIAVPANLFQQFNIHFLLPIEGVTSQAAISALTSLGPQWHKPVEILDKKLTNYVTNLPPGQKSLKSLPEQLNALLVTPFWVKPRHALTLPDPFMLFSGVVATSCNLPASDKKDVTHLFALSTPIIVNHTTINNDNHISHHNALELCALSPVNANSDEEDSTSEFLRQCTQWPHQIGSSDKESPPSTRTSMEPGSPGLSNEAKAIIEETSRHLDRVLQWEPSHCTLTLQSPASELSDEPASFDFRLEDGDWCVEANRTGNVVSEHLDVDDFFSALNQFDVWEWTSDGTVYEGTTNCGVPTRKLQRRH
ncbi:hypothetical protein BC835DRAFT_1311624 [Cytidiella melzeri]|nr:hypothetical protein BC835DRAFT_1311624 [Cytidiella melzeri]